MIHHKLEICVDTVQSAIAAEKGGADRVELCSALSEGGLTPSIGIIAAVRKAITIDIQVLIRPRRGDFNYSELELAAMRHDIEAAKKLGANGIVVGVLQRDGRIDIVQMKELIALSLPLNVTFHRAFDLTPDPLKALDDLLTLKIDRVLTSGQHQNAEDGVDLIARLVKNAGEKFIVMPGGGINENNVHGLMTATGAKEFHTSARIKKDSLMNYRKEAVLMAGNSVLSEYELMETSVEKVKAIKDALRT